MSSSWNYVIIFLSIQDCAYGQLVNNGQCNEEANNEECMYDGGDCAGTSECQNLILILNKSILHM